MRPLVFKALATALAACLFTVVIQSLQAADIQNGVSVYAEYCEDCHGPSGEGVAGMGELRSWEKLMKTDEELFGAIRDGDLAMPGFDGLLTSEEILDVIAYMRTFQ